MAEPGNTTSDTIASNGSTAATSNPRKRKADDITKIKLPWTEYSYSHLEALRRDSSDPFELDLIQVRSYCSAALKQFLGVSGQAIPIDILHLDGPGCWLRVPRDDLNKFCAAITAWQGTYEGGTHTTLRIKGCSDYLGQLVGSKGREEMWFK